MKFLFIFIIISILSILVFNLDGAISTATATSSFQIFPKDSSPYGIPYSEWVGKWWAWWTGIPIDKHPAKDYSDFERCSAIQNGPVWFLPDILPGHGKINYECNIPVDKAILLPITTTFCEKVTTITCGPITTDEELAESADNILTPVKNMEVTVDGIKVSLEGYLVKTNFFNVTFPENPVDIFGPINPGTYRSLATGYFLFLHDLSPGEHNIELRVVDLLKGNEGPPPRFDPMREANFKIVIQ